jgi:DNA-binding SARP family transcriptional activator
MIEFRALGAVELKAPEGNELLSILARPKLLAILSYMAASATRGFVRRDTLIGLFWADVDPERARNSLRQSLHHLRRSLGEATLLSRGDEEVGLASGRFWSDVAAFEDALQAGRAEEALSFYRGELLEGFFVSDAPEFERWLEGRRGELRARAAAAAWALAEEAESARDSSSAAGWARRALELAPLDEDLVRRVIALLDRQGDRSGAVQSYEAFARRLHDELELEPAPETRRLVEAVRARSRPDGEPGQIRAGGAAAATPRQPSTVAVPPGRPSGRRLNFRLGLVAGSAIVIGLVAIGSFQLLSRAPELDARRVLVIAFDNQTGDPELDPLGRMAADWITRGIQQTALLEAVPPEATQQLVAGTKRAGEGERTLAELTGAGTLISGAVYLLEDSLQFQAHVTDVENRRILVSVESDRSARSDPGRAVESLRQRVVGALAMTHDGRIAVYANVGQRPPTFEAYRAFAEGEELYNRAFTPGNSDLRAEALALFARAVELDSTLHAARQRAASALGLLGRPAEGDSLLHVVAAHRDELSGYARAELDILLADFQGDRIRALEAARRRSQGAVDPAPLDRAARALWANRPRETVETLKNAEWYPSAMHSAGLFGIEEMYWQFLAAGYHMLGDHRRELRVARRGRERFPSALGMLHLEVGALAALGRVDELYERLDEGLSLPPRQSTFPVPQGASSAGQLMMAAAAELRAHGYAEASHAVAHRAIGWYRSLPPEARATDAFRYDLAAAYYVAGRWDLARAMFEQLAEEEPDNINWLGFLGVLAARRGDRDEAMRMSEALVGKASPYDHGREPYWQACIAAQLGERERAMALLRQAYNDGRPFDLRLHRDVDLAPLHGYPPFEELLKPKG